MGGGKSLSAVNELESRVVLSASALGGGVSPAKGAPANYSGSWKIDGFPTFVLTLSETGSKVTGTFSGNLGASTFYYTVRGHVHGEAMSIKGKGQANAQASKMNMHVSLTTPVHFAGTGVTKTSGISSGPQPVTGDHL